MNRNCLQVNRALTNLDLSYNGLGDEGAAAIGDALKVRWILRLMTACRMQVNHTLTVLNLHVNQIGPVGAAVICAALQVMHVV